MSKVDLTNHAIVRMAQRGITPADIDFIMAIGSDVEDGIFVRRKDVQRIEQAVKQFMNKLKKLEGKRLVLSDGHLVTAYQADASDERRLLRRH